MWKQKVKSFRCVLRIVSLPWVCRKSSVVTKRSKHINLRYHMVRDHVKSLCYCPTDRNLADPLTKGLAGGKYISLFHIGNPECQVVETSKSCLVSFANFGVY